MTWMVRDKTLSDYLDACKDATTDLSNFKRDPRYTSILEHTSYKQGLEYLQVIKKDNPKLLKFPGIFDGDSIGNPVTHNFEGIDCSATTLQYIAVLSNLIKNFGHLKGKSIVEIGGGYGGQCQVIQTAYEVGSYKIVDLEQACLLQNKYLFNFRVEVSCTWDMPDINDYDLCISNYALSEIKDPLQKKYVNNICKRSTNGYVTCNGEIPSLTWGERSPDIKTERKENFIIKW